ASGGSRASGLVGCGVPAGCAILSPSLASVLGWRSDPLTKRSDAAEDPARARMVPSSVRATECHVAHWSTGELGSGLRLERSLGLPHSESTSKPARLASCLPRGCDGGD